MFSNKIYLKKDLELKNTISVYTRIIDRIEQLDGYIPGKTPVAFIGTLGETDLVKYRGDMSYYGTGLWDNFSVTSNHSTVGFINNYLNYPMIIMKNSEVSIIEKEKEVQEMPCFPSIESIKMFDNIVVVKLVK